MQTNRESPAPSHEERVLQLQKKHRNLTYQNTMLSVSSVLLFFIAWQVSCSIGLIPGRFLSPPIDIFNLFISKFTEPDPDGAVLMVNIFSSLQVALSGLALGVIIGVPLGLLMGWYRGIDVFMRPIFEIIRPIPPVSWIPLTIVWMGVGLKSKAFIVFFAAFVPCLINSYTGIRQTSEVLINVSKTCGASNFTTFLRVGIPSSLTLMFAGVKVAVGNAWATLVAAEMLAASSGLGYMILMGRSYGRVDLVILGIVVIGIIGTIITSLLNLLEKRMLGWKRV